MAGDWIKMRSNIKDDPDVIQMAVILDSDEFSIVGRLHSVWAWLDQHSTDGLNVRISSAYLDRLTACPGFAEAMRAVSWLSGRDGALTFPGFDRHNGEPAKARAADAKRKKKSRKGVQTQPDDQPDICPESSGPEKRREEKNREEEEIEEISPLRSESSDKPDPVKSIVDLVWEKAPEKARRRSSKKQCIAALRSVKVADRPSEEEALAAITAWSNCEDWKKDGGEFVPGLHRWIKDEKWRDLPGDEGTQPLEF